MTTKIEITSLSHDDLVNLFSSAFYGNDSYYVMYDNDLYKEYTENQECFEDKLAEILLNGGKIDIVDLNADNNETPYKNDSNPCLATVEEIEFNNWFGLETYNLPTYHISLDNVLKGISTPGAYKYAKELLVDEDGDMYTADSLLQHILFGKLIYG